MAATSGFRRGWPDSSATSVERPSERPSTINVHSVVQNEGMGWTWEATATIIQAVATVVALAGVAVTFYYSLRAERREHARTQAEAQRAREEAERSEASAERAERAAALSIDVMSRIADAVEELSQKEFAATVLSPAEPKRVRWSLKRFDRDTYILTNDGNVTAHNVTITVDETLHTVGTLPQRQDMRPDDSITFMALVTMATRDTTVTVKWSASESEGAAVDTWRYPLPSRG